MSFSLFFASSNKNKFTEAKSILTGFGLKLEFLKCNLQEIQADSIEEIAKNKAIEAFYLCSKPVIVEDDGLFIKSLQDFPGSYSSYVFSTIGSKGILKLVSSNRAASFRSIIAYCDNQKSTHLFGSELKGKISKKEVGVGWGFDPIFIPAGKSKTFAQIEDKNKISHRFLALKKFANWYLHKKKSND